MQVQALRYKFDRSPARKDGPSQTLCSKDSCPLGQPQDCAGRLFLLIFFRERVLGALLIPEDAYHVPTLTIVKKLKAVDAASKGLFTWGVSRFVGAEDVSFLAKLLGFAREFTFIESMFLEIFCRAFNVTIGGKRAGGECSVGFPADGTHACVRKE